MQTRTQGNPQMDYDALPADIPPKFVYFLNKAELYLKIGPERHRQADALGMPDESFSPGEMYAIRRGMEQICQSRGYTPEKPFVDLDIAGFYALMRTLHFNLARQVLAEYREADGEILDEMHMAHVLDGEEIVLYNLVPAPEARRKAERARSKKGKKQS